MRNVAVFGASGMVGSMLASFLMHRRILARGDRVTLMGRDSEPSRRTLAAAREDLLDAFHEEGIEVAHQSDFDLPGCDVFVMCAGVTVSPDQPSREELAKQNAPLFEETARRLAAHHPNAFVVVISNPVELGVAIFAQHFDRRKVIGMGAQQDSLRFARAIAEKLGVARDDVDAPVLGQHGEHMVPLWSAIRLTGEAAAKSADLAALRARYEDKRSQTVPELLKQASDKMDNAGPETAFEALDEGSPETRILVEPLIATFILHAMPNSTANAALQVVEAILRPDDRTIQGQVLLQGELSGLTGVCGAPLRVSEAGWSVASDPQPSPQERDLLAEAIAASEREQVFPLSKSGASVGGAAT